MKSGGAAGERSAGAAKAAAEEQKCGRPGGEIFGGKDPRQAREKAGGRESPPDQGAGGFPAFFSAASAIAWYSRKLSF